MKSKPLIAIVAGEISGDKLGAGLMQALLRIYPDARFTGIGGEAMLAQGLKSLYPIERLSVMGIGAILKRLPELLGLRKRLVNSWSKLQRPDCFIGIDAPEFNTSLEFSLKSAGIKTIHYVSPSIWAWRPSRINKIRRAVDHMLTLFPFENAIYDAHNVDVTCVGHPMANEIPMNYDSKQAKHALGYDENTQLLALLPGSRGSELKYLAPLFLKVANSLHQQNPRLQFITPLANNQCRFLFSTALESFPELPIKLVQQQSTAVMMAADVVLLASGTATLEAALLKRPMIVAYKVSGFSYHVFKSLSVLTHYALPNLLCKNAFIEEFLQAQATLPNLKSAVQKLLEASAEEKLILTKKYQNLHQSLILGGSKKAAKVVSEVIENSKLGTAL